MRLAALAIAVLLAPAIVPAASTGGSGEDPVHGLWLTENGRAIVQFAACGAEACGQMVWVANPRDDAGDLKLDLKNPEADKRTRPLCGLQLVGGLQNAKPGAWDGGWIYSPRDGDTYSVEITAVSDTELEVHGYLGIPLLGKSQIWTRVPDNRGGC